ncbi:MAG: ABC transporter substrate-binding protein [Desulfobacteraceae bacterium]
MSRNSGVIIFLLVLVCGVSCDTAPENRQSTGNRAGVSDGQILIGSSLALGGHAGYLGTRMLEGARAYIRHVNDSGGIHQRKIKVIARDDRYDPATCLFNTQQLIIDDGVFALFCYVGTPTTVKIIPLVTEAAIPVVGMFTGASRLRKPVNRYLINIRASYYQETRAAVDFIVQEQDLSRVAVFYQYDEYGFDGLRGSELALKEHGLKPVAKGSYIRGTKNVEKGLDKIIASKAQAVVMIGTYDVCARFIQLAEQKGFSPLFYNVSFVGSEELARRLGNTDQKVLVTQVVPPPAPDVNQNRNTQGVQQYTRLMQRYYPGSRPNVAGLEGYINARVLVEGLKRAGRDLTRTKFINAIESIKSLDLGISNRISFGRRDHQGLDRVYFTRIENGKLVLVK